MPPPPTHQHLLDMCGRKIKPGPKNLKNENFHFLNLLAQKELLRDEETLTQWREAHGLGQLIDKCRGGNRERGWRSGKDESKNKPQ